jgi:hypothetical protein
MDRSMIAVLGASGSGVLRRPATGGPARWTACGRACVLAALLVAVAFAALDGVLAGSQQPAQSVLDEAAVPPGVAARLPSLARGEISGMIAAEDPAYRAAPSAGGYSIENRRQRFVARFDGAGVHVHAPGIDVGLRLQTLGVGRRPASVATVAPTAAANSVSYDRRALGEWYRNGPQGLEQGFVIGARRLGGAGGSLTLALALSGGARPTISADRQSISLRHGSSTLLYDALAATDASGRVLPSSMALARGKLLLRIDARDARYPLTIDPRIQLGDKLTTGEPENEARFGAAAALSGDGDTLAIGGPQDNGSQGAVWVFARSGSSWKLQAKLMAGQAPSAAVDECAEEAAEEAGECAFGASVALSDDGDTLVIGDPSAGPTAGAAWIFRRGESGWAKMQVLHGNDEAGEGRFGRSVALSGDGATALVGDPSAASQRGAAWVFALAEGTWQTEARLIDAEALASAHFGRSVALSADGATALIGGPGASGFTGAAWTFTRSGASWTQQVRRLTGAGESGAGHFGKTVALSGDAGTALVGGQDDGEERGAVWAFARSGPAFEQPGYEIEPPQDLGDAHFGASLALSRDGTIALVGAPRSEDGVGAVVEVLRSGASWILQQEQLGGSEAVGRGFAGASTALSSDGTVAAIGAPRDAKRAGAAWTFRSVPSAQVPGPNVANVAPGHGVSGTAVEIQGSNFSGAQAVHFGETSAQFTVVSQARIRAVAPAAPAGRVEVTVTTPAGTSALSPPGDYFTIEPSSGSDPGLAGAGAGTGVARSGAAGGVLGFVGSQSAACRVSLSKRRLAVTRYRSVALRLRRTGAGACRGKIALSYRVRAKRRRYMLRTIGTASFSIPSGASRVLTIKLTKAGQAWLRLHHGQASASLAIARVTPAPVLAQSASVRLSLKTARRAST